MTTFEVTSATGGGVNIKGTVSLAKECQDLIIKAAGLTKIRDQVLLPIMHYLSREAETKMTLSSDPIKLTWEILRQGSFMCELLNQVQPGVITEVFLPVPPITPGHFKDINSRQNISAFVKACKDMFFMKDDELFNVGDLYKEDFIAFSKALKLCQFYLNNKLRVSTRNSINLNLEDLDEDEAKLFELKKITINEDDENASSAKKSKKFDLLVQELVASERVYVNDLAKLNQFSEALKSAHIISQPVFYAIFSNLKQLVNFQRKFLIQLESEVAKKNNMDLGSLFQANESEFQVYEPFCINHKTSLKTLADQMPNLQKQSDLLENIGDLSGYLIKPVQRITRYHLFLRDLLKESKKHGYNDISSLSAAITVIRGITLKINEKQREVENEALATDFYEHFQAGKVTAEKTGKLILFDYLIKVKIGENIKKYRMYVFERRIFMCSERDMISPFWVKNQLSTNTIKNVFLRDSDLESEPFEVEVNCEDNDKIASWSILLRNDQQANLWHSKLRKVAGLPEDTVAKKDVEEVIEILPVEEPLPVEKESNKVDGKTENERDFTWIVEFMDEFYFVVTDFVPKLSVLKEKIRSQIELEFDFDGKSTSLIPSFQNLALQFKLDEDYIHLQDDRTVSFLVQTNTVPIRLRLYKPQQIKVRALFREVLYSFTVLELETLAELKEYIYETIKEDYLQIDANVDAIPAPEKMRLFFKEEDGQWSILLYDNDLENALEVNKYQIDGSLMEKDNHFEVSLDELVSFSAAIKSRNFNSGFREGLFKGKQEVVQDGFDEGFVLSALMTIYSKVDNYFVQNSNDTESYDKIDLLNQISKVKMRLFELVPNLPNFEE